MNIDVSALSLAAKQRIRNKTNDDKDLLIVQLLDSTGDALLSAAEHKANYDRSQTQVGEAQAQIRTLVRDNDLLSSRLAKYQGSLDTMAKH